MRRLTCAKPLLCTAALQRDTSIYQRDWLCHQALGERADEGPLGAQAAPPTSWYRAQSSRCGAQLLDWGWSWAA